ncbi:precorrin-3B C(17)-methyltransferase [Streptomyces sp. NPDC127068]|uniref:precorrin-3B C(17)-methyltransferase n=1 Tax=Streptomyces sp. NPDC127068 TaxID=3347127 RepID=UPI003649DE37
MTRIRPRLTTAAPSLALLALTATGCAFPTDPNPAPGASSSAPAPPVTDEWNDRFAENHAYRKQASITAEQRREAGPRAEALATALRKLADSGSTTEAALRTVAARALGLRPEHVESVGDRFAPLRNALVGGGEGSVCVNGTVHATGKVQTEVVGRTADGTCIPDLGKY